MSDRRPLLAVKRWRQTPRIDWRERNRAPFVARV